MFLCPRGKLDKSCAVHMSSQFPANDGIISSSGVGQSLSRTPTACRISLVSSCGVDTLGGTLDSRSNSATLFLFRASFPSIVLPFVLKTKTSAKQKLFSCSSWRELFPTSLTPLTKHASADDDIATLKLRAINAAACPINFILLYGSGQIALLYASGRHCSWTELFPLYPYPDSHGRAHYSRHVSTKDIKGMFSIRFILFSYNFVQIPVYHH